jgi:hypothetical protein
VKLLRKKGDAAAESPSKKTRDAENAAERAVYRREYERLGNSPIALAILLVAVFAAFAAVAVVAERARRDGHPTPGREGMIALVRFVFGVVCCFAIPLWVFRTSAEDFAPGRREGLVLTGAPASDYARAVVGSAVVFTACLIATSAPAVATAFAYRGVSLTDVACAGVLPLGVASATSAAAVILAAGTCAFDVRKRRVAEGCASLLTLCVGYGFWSWLSTTAADLLRSTTRIAPIGATFFNIAILGAPPVAAAAASFIFDPFRPRRAEDAAAAPRPTTLPERAP